MAFAVSGSQWARVNGFMTLVPESILKYMPPLYATEHVPLEEKVVRVKLFVPWSSFTFWLIECEKDGPVAWGLVVGHEAEFGYFDLGELATVRGPGGLTIERDIHFAPCTVRELIVRERIGISL
jgi:hypothetical protein